MKDLKKEENNKTKDQSDSTTKDPISRSAGFWWTQIKTDLVKKSQQVLN